MQEQETTAGLLNEAIALIQKLTADDGVQFYGGAIYTEGAIDGDVWKKEADAFIERTKKAHK